MPATDVWAQWGIAGVLIGVIVVAAWTLLTSVLKARDTDLMWYRAEYTAKRAEYLASIDRMQREYHEKLEKIAVDFGHMAESICERMEHMEQRLEFVIRDISASRGGSKG